MLNIKIKSIPHNQQRYDTVGDWFYDADGTLNITISDMEDERHELLVALHELIEVHLCKHKGISQEDADSFDMNYQGKDPGSDPLCPYFYEHQIANIYEHSFATDLGVFNWTPSPYWKLK